MKKTQLLVLGLFLAKPAIALPEELMGLNSQEIFVNNQQFLQIINEMAQNIELARVTTVSVLQLAAVLKVAYSTILPEHLSQNNKERRMLGIVLITTLIAGGGFAYPYIKNPDEATISQALKNAGIAGSVGFIVAITLAITGVFDK
jgi:hypothetical protein